MMRSIVDRAAAAAAAAARPAARGSHAAHVRTHAAVLRRVAGGEDGTAQRW